MGGSFTTRYCRTWARLEGLRPSHALYEVTWRALAIGAVVIVGGLVILIMLVLAIGWLLELVGLA